VNPAVAIAGLVLNGDHRRWRIGTLAGLDPRHDRETHHDTPVTGRQFSRCSDSSDDVEHFLNVVAFVIVSVIGWRCARCEWPPVGIAVQREIAFGDPAQRSIHRGRVNDERRLF
jgi:hypothetical protein